MGLHLAAWPALYQRGEQMSIDFLNMESDRIEALARKYQAGAGEMYRQMKGKTARTEYGTGGECLHRGFYCPSKIFDIVVGNVGRGKVTKQPPTLRQADFVYGFDGENRMITVDSPDSCELILHQEQQECGITLDKSGGVGAISECCFDADRILSYCRYLLDPYTGKVIERTQEQYQYEQDQLLVHWSRFTRLTTPQLLQQVVYHFSAEDGYLTSYTTEEFIGDRKKESVWDSHIFQVRKKRRI